MVRTDGDVWSCTVGTVGTGAVEESYENKIRLFYLASSFPSLDLILILYYHDISLKQKSLTKGVSNDSFGIISSEVWNWGKGVIVTSPGTLQNIRNCRV